MSETYSLESDVIERQSVLTGQNRQKVSALVISYNQSAIIGTCLRALAFADEVVVVDKSSTDGTAEIAAVHADRVISVPWSPVVEDTRAFAIAECKYDWVLCLDDDECLSVEAIKFIQEELIAPRADIYAFDYRHYLLGHHNEASYYWPDPKQRLFLKASVRMLPKVHGGMEILSDSVYKVPSDTGIFVHHLTNASVSQWIEKCNRYTSQPDRAKPNGGVEDLAAYAHSRIDEFVRRSQTTDGSSYVTAVAVLRATYDIIDRLKVWEEESGIDGEITIKGICADLNRQYAAAVPEFSRALSSPSREREARIDAKPKLAALEPSMLEEEKRARIHAEKRLLAIESSKFGKLTGPLRALSKKFKRKRSTH